MSINNSCRVITGKSVIIHISRILFVGGGDVGCVHMVAALTLVCYTRYLR